MSGTDSTVAYRPIEGFPLYRVGDDGSVWSRYYGVGRNGGVSEDWHRLQGAVNDQGDVMVNMRSEDGTSKGRPVQRLVLLAFVGPPGPREVAKFRDGNKQNNLLSNLFWGRIKRSRPNATRVDLTGRKFGRWTAIAIAPRERRTRWLCRCECGTEAIRSATNLVGGKTLSCGCLRDELAAERNTTHGMSNNRLLWVWHAMVARCHKPGASQYENYGGRGISVCDRWRNDVRAFYADMGEPPSKKHTIDRIDNDGNYEPGNCRWATMAEQNRNNRHTHFVTLNGKTQCLKDWCAELGIKYFTVLARIRRGESDVDALTRPLLARRVA